MARSFRLVRYFSATSFAAIAVVVVALVYAYSWNAERELLEQGQQKNAAQAKLILNGLGSVERYMVESLLTATVAPRPDAIAVTVLHEGFATGAADTRVRKIKLYNLAGLTVYSSEPKQLGENRSDDPGVQAALQGKVLSEMVHRSAMSGFDRERVDVDLIASYVPVFDSNRKVVGVMKVYDDVTNLIATIAATRWKVLALTLTLMLALYVALLLIVRHAARVIDEYSGWLQNEITERTKAVRHAEAARQEAEALRLRAEAADRAKSEFLANVGHEILTPLNGVLGMTELLLNTDTTTEHQPQLQVIRSSATSLHGIINDILDFAQADAHRITLHPNPMSPKLLCEQLVQTLIDQARERSIRLYCEVDRGLPELILADEFRLRRVLSILLGNALKFTLKGEVRLRALRVEDGHGPRVSFAVEDTGAGIAREHLEAIFDPFVQADGSITRRYGGTGLGLAIAKRLIALMGGTLRVESEVGSGSRFHFSIPADAVQTPPATAASSTTVMQKAVLVAEDNEINQCVAAAMLEKLGFAVTVADNGEAALDLVRSQNFALVLMDMQMPVLDGVEATRRIRAWESDNHRPKVPIVALTANAMESDRNVCLAAGMDYYLAKPVLFDELIAAVKRFVPV